MHLPLNKGTKKYRLESHRKTITKKFFGHFDNRELCACQSQIKLAESLYLTFLLPGNDFHEIQQIKCFSRIYLVLWMQWMFDAKATESFDDDQQAHTHTLS